MPIYNNPFLISQVVYAPNGVTSIDYSQQPKNVWAQQVNDHINDLEQKIAELEAKIEELAGSKSISEINGENWTVD